jgi:hypothetical protein
MRVSIQNVIDDVLCLEGDEEEVEEEEVEDNDHHREVHTSVHCNP